MDKNKIIEIIEDIMKAAEAAGENWADYIEGRFDGLTFYRDNNIPSFESGYYIVSGTDGTQVFDVWVDGDSYSVDIR